MKKESLKRKIESVDQRKILNSHAQFTTEFVFELDDGTIGVGSSPRGETTSIYEKDKQARPQRVIERLHRDRARATYARNLEFATFHFRGTVLDSDTAFQLVTRDQINWGSKRVCVSGVNAQSVSALHARAAVALFLRKRESSMVRLLSVV
ncbi:MAG: hypothetical protein JSV85_00825 [Candidatus Bathyarchaeota archaeon]|nr:MAG: hypothetical protein JSV85_00825 [Candidatus Bathyarchaeota archaeon]